MFKIKSLYKLLPFINCTISTCAFIFQVTILNPGHKKISFQIEKLEKNFNVIYIPNVEKSLKTGTGK
jgi:hypothetical protein